MDFGVSIFLIAVGAILTFAVHAAVSGIDIGTVGVILMLLGGAGLLWSLFVYSSASRQTVGARWYRPNYRSTTTTYDQRVVAAPPVVQERTVVRDDVI